MAWVYDDRRDGGPQSPGILNLIVCHLRRMGFPIVTHWGRGYRYQPRIWEVTP